MIKSRILFAAGIYNLLWGAWVIIFPYHFWNLVNITPPNYIELWQCIGMIVGVYGIGYLIAAYDPMKHWPIILVGFLGKILGPVGFIKALWTNVFPLSFGIINIFNDIIWIYPFGQLLLNKWNRELKSEFINWLKK